MLPTTRKSDITEEVQNYKTLGVVIANNMFWTTHVNALNVTTSLQKYSSFFS